MPFGKRKAKRRARRMGDSHSKDWDTLDSANKKTDPSTPFLNDCYKGYGNVDKKGDGNREEGEVGRDSGDDNNNDENDDDDDCSHGEDVDVAKEESEDHAISLPHAIDEFPPGLSPKGSFEDDDLPSSPQNDAVSLSKSSPELLE